MGFFSKVSETDEGERGIVGREVLVLEEEGA